MILPEYLEVQFGYAVRQRHQAGEAWSVPVLSTIGSFTPYRMILVHSGHLEVCHRERRMQLQAGAFLLMPPNSRLENQSRRVIHDCQLTSFGFRLLLFGNISISSLLQEVTVWHPDQTRYHALSVLTQTLLSMQTLPGIPRDCILNGTTSAIVGLSWEALGLEAVLNKLHPNMPTWLHRVMECIRHNPGTSVTELVKLTGYGHSQFHRAFQQHVGVSPRMYLQQYRMSLAKQLLSTTEMNITEIANHIGYTNSSDFTRCFRRICLATPSEYRTSTIQSGLDTVV